MSTKRVAIQAQERLEGILSEGAGKGGVVICHPHPLYGGSIWNSVVEAIEAGFQKCGFATLKFNFRGVGSSTGSYGDGLGETEDVLAAYAYLKERMPASAPFVLAGYSFGAWISGMAISKVDRVTDLFLVAYPFSAYSPGDLVSFRGRMCMVGGAYDDISPVDDLLAFYEKLECDKSLKIIPTSHFYDGREDEISEFIVASYGNGKG